MRILLVLAVATFLAYPVSDDFIVFFKVMVLGDYADSVIVLTPFEAVMVRLKASFFIAFTASTPFISSNFLAYVFPALKKEEKNLFLKAFMASLILFSVGCAFAVLILLPTSYRILLGFAQPIASPMLSLEKLTDLSITLIIMSGIIFQWPLIASILSRLKLVSPRKFKEKRRHAILASFTLAAVVTDPSIITQVMLGIPMILLYELGIIMASQSWKN